MCKLRVVDVTSRPFILKVEFERLRIGVEAHLTSWQLLASASQACSEDDFAIGGPCWFGVIGQSFNALPVYWFPDEQVRQNETLSVMPTKPGKPLFHVSTAHGFHTDPGFSTVVLLK